ncbi:MAG: hypothetical protein ACLROG_16115 [Coprococcus phoceensis]
MAQKKEWKGLKSIVMEKKTLETDGIEKEEYRYFISSLREDIELDKPSSERALEYRKYALASGCNLS